jgi:hypothetical protein
MLVLLRDTHESLVVLDSRDSTVLVRTVDTRETLVFRGAGGNRRSLTAGKRLGSGTFEDFPLRRHWTFGSQPYPLRRIQ